MLNNYLNLEANKAGAPLFNIDESRVEELNKELNGIAHDIFDNYKDYTFVDEDGDPGLAAGPALKRILQIATNDQEELCLLFYANSFLQYVADDVSTLLNMSGVSKQDFQNQQQ